MHTLRTSSHAPLRIFCLEDNPLIVFHLEMMIEDSGNTFVGSTDSFVDLRNQAALLEIDCALVDIDLADGPTGPEAVVWLSARGIPAAFLTGQEAIAAQYRDSVVAIIDKPVTEASLAAGLQALENTLRPYASFGRGDNATHATGTGLLR